MLIATVASKAVYCRIVQAHMVVFTDPTSLALLSTPPANNHVPIGGTRNKTRKKGILVYFCTCFEDDLMYDV